MDKLRYKKVSSSFVSFNHKAQALVCSIWMTGRFFITIFYISHMKQPGVIQYKVTHLSLLRTAMTSLRSSLLCALSTGSRGGCQGSCTISSPARPLPQNCRALWTRGYMSLQRRLSSPRSPTHLAWSDSLSAEAGVLRVPPVMCKGLEIRMMLFLALLQSTHP